MGKYLVIVESPAKARTLGKILGKNYSLKSSVGHVRDLSRSQLSVDIENGFLPKYVVPRVKSKLVGELKKAIKTASVVYLATDPDREGEAIAWHLAEVTKSDHASYRRVIFHEITEEAVKDAFKHYRSLDMALVDAQQARRILDRLVGYKISPLLWRNVRSGLSAGRVQSVAVKIVVDREQEILGFTPVEYWTIEAKLTKKDEKTSFRAMLIGAMGNSKLDIHTQEEADDINNELEQATYSVFKATTKKTNRQPAPPFITSTLQQEASRKFRFSAKQTMALAQQLYEGLPISSSGNAGLITYMRTDSTRVATSAIAEVRNFIRDKYGAQFVPPKARFFTRKVKGAQEAHEAIRPTKIRREPTSIKQFLDKNQLKLYTLIWKRMIASQMAAAVFDNTTVDIEAKRPEKAYLLRTSTSVNVFPGFITLYSEGEDEADKVEKSSPLPQLKKSDTLALLGLLPEQKFTQPPPRFTEASLIKTLERWGIGRPSTYAPTLSTIQEREYVTKVSGFLQPTELGCVVNDLLNQHFPDILNVKFTAQMENKLDDIANETRDWVGVINDFYVPFNKTLEKAAHLVKKVKLTDELTDEACPQCGKPLAVKTGRFGKFLACTGYPECKFTKSLQVKIGVKCPNCDGELIERKSKKKRAFYGCNKYPDCKFITSSKPIPKPCLQCGGILTMYRGNQVKCTKCDYKGYKGKEK